MINRCSRQVPAATHRYKYLRKSQQPQTGTNISRFSALEVISLFPFLSYTATRHTGPRFTRRQVAAHALLGWPRVTCNLARLCHATHRWRVVLKDDRRGRPEIRSNSQRFELWWEPENWIFTPLIYHERSTNSILYVLVLRIEYFENKNTLQLWDRRFCRNSSLQAVCDTPIARITSCVSSLRI